MVTHCSVLAWRIPGTAEPGGLLSMGLHRVRHDCSDLATAAAAVGYYRCYIKTEYVYLHVCTHFKYDNVPINLQEKDI